MEMQKKIEKHTIKHTTQIYVKFEGLNALQLI